LDNVFQSIRGGVVQRYGVDPLSHFNLLYTFGRQATMAGKYYRPQHAILSEINRAKRSIKACLFLLGELQGEYHDSVVDALIAAKRRGVEVHLIINGHMARQGDPGKEYTMEEELRRPLTPAVARLHRAAVPMALAYGVTDHRVPYCPLHSKYCVIDDYIVLEGSFNWYNTSTFSHDLLVVAASPALARAYLHEFHQILRLFRFPSLSFKI
jgi:phosphatidylserine/phosphatidylglycerophosphate/cardiolipin synthase-like enzyme